MDLATDTRLLTDHVEHSLTFLRIPIMYQKLFKRSSYSDL